MEKKIKNSVSNSHLDILSTKESSKLYIDDHFTIRENLNYCITSGPAILNSDSVFLYGTSAASLDYLSLNAKDIVGSKVEPEYVEEFAGNNFLISAIDAIDCSINGIPEEIFNDNQLAVYNEHELVDATDFLIVSETDFISEDNADGMKWINFNSGPEGYQNSFVNNDPHLLCNDVLGVDSHINHLLDKKYVSNPLLAELEDSIKGLDNSVSNFINQFQGANQEALAHILSGSKEIVEEESKSIKRLYKSITETIDISYVSEKYADLYSLLGLSESFDLYVEQIWQRFQYKRDNLYSEFQRIQKNFEKHRKIFLKPFLVKVILHDVRVALEESWDLFSKI